MKKVLIIISTILFCILTVSGQNMIERKASSSGKKTKKVTNTTHITPKKSEDSTGPSSKRGEDYLKKDIETITVNGVSFKMIKVEGGSYMMGSNDGDSDEKPVHSETVGTFHIGETEVTQALWTAVMGTNPSYWGGANLPVEQVSWDDCQTFIKKLNDLTGKNFRLPTEVEWEYAARGGNQSLNYTYSGSNNIGEVAWYTNNSGSMTHPVAQKLPNELGIYDMSGNVWEWCQDYYSSSYSDPRNSSNRVDRGGSWSSTAALCRVANRDYSPPSYRCSFLGLRLAL